MQNKSAHQPAANALLEQQAQLLQFSKQIDGKLRAHFGNRRLWKLLRPMKYNREFQQNVGFLRPSKWSVFLSILVFALCLGLTRGQSLWFWFCVFAAVANFFVWEWKILPRLALMKYRFTLMRLDAVTDDEKFPAIYSTAHCPKTLTGFDYTTWKGAGAIEEGDIVVGVWRGNDGVAQIPLQKHGKQSVLVWHRELYQRDVFAELPQAVLDLAVEFDQQATVFAHISAKLETERKLKSQRHVPQAKDPALAWKGVILDGDSKQRLLQIGDDFAQGQATAPRGLLLYGPPGTGKTLIAKALAESMGCAFFPLSLPDLKAGYIGQSGERVKQIWDKALAEPRAVIFVDECEGVFARRGSVETDSFANEIVTAFIAQWDGFSKQRTVLVVGATNRHELIDPAVLSRFDEQMKIGLPAVAARLDIFSTALQELGINTPLPDGLAGATEGFSGRDLAGIAKRVARDVQQGKSFDNALLQQHTGALRKQGATQVQSDARWDTLVLPEQTIKELKATAGMLKHAADFQARGLSIPRGLLLYGPPGTGKTQIARTLANETGLHFIAATTADLKQGYTGQSGQKVRELFERAREQAPALLFLDEIDIVASARGGAGDSFEREIVGQLLQEMDGAAASDQHVFVLAATNRIDCLDSALLSRLPKKIEIPVPQASELERLWQVMLAGKPLAFDLEEGARTLAAQTQGLSGRDIRNAIAQAEQNAVMRALENASPDAVSIELGDFSF